MGGSKRARRGEERAARISEDDAADLAAVRRVKAHLRLHGRQLLTPEEVVREIPDLRDLPLPGRADRRDSRGDPRGGRPGVAEPGGLETVGADASATPSAPA